MSRTVNEILWEVHGLGGSYDNELEQEEKILEQLEEELREVIKNED